jgi:exodeoxyribonuclease-3
MKIISYNVNGIRSALNKGLLEWLRTENPDVLCLQELKAMEEQVDWTALKEMGYHIYLNPAQKKGYSGVGILSKIPADRVVCGMGIEQHDAEGRVIRADFAGLTVVSVYFPSGTSGTERQDVKYIFLADFRQWASTLVQERAEVLIAGDVNICHQEMDIHNPVSNKNSTGFLPEERAWVDSFLNAGWVDSFRALNPDLQQYSWWSFRANARANNKGWRIDYQFATQALGPRLKAAGLLQEATHSDHCPTVVEISAF